MRLRRFGLAAAFVAAIACSSPSAVSTTTAPSPSASASSGSASTSAAPTPGLTPTPQGSTPVPTQAPTPTAAPPVDLSLPQVRLVRAMGALTFTQMTGAFQALDGRWYVLEQPGRILTFREGDAQATLFLDIRDHVESGGEKGLLGFAFAPDFDRSGVFFLDYTRGGPLRTEIASFASNRAVADKASEIVILEIPQPFDNHNGGQLAVGPDGYLYIGMGDGGSGGDPQRNGQNRNALLAKLLRIDVSDRTRYRVCCARIDDDERRGRGEIWAYGLRNPWRFSFDTETGALWLADVGQGAWEEIDLMTRGANYGWNVMEGMHCYNATRCDSTGLTPPIAEYDHSLGCSVTGGYVHHGTAPDLRGVYLYADYCSGRLWGIRYQAGRVVAQAQIATTGFQVASFAQDRVGEVYVLQYASPGGIYKITR